MKHQNSIKGVTYKNNPNLVEHQWFPVEYFSGSDVTVYFGDVFLSECNNLSFQIEETVQPVFGYASHTWDCASRGNRLVRGNFEIPFTEAGYLEAILTHIGQYTTDMEKVKPKMAYKLNDQKVPNWCADYKMDVKELFDKFDPGRKSATAKTLITPGSYSDQIASFKSVLSENVGYQDTPLSLLIKERYGTLSSSTCALLEREVIENESMQKIFNEALQKTINIIYEKDEKNRFENKDTLYSKSGVSMSRKLTKLNIDGVYDGVTSDALYLILSWFKFENIQEVKRDASVLYEHKEVLVINADIIRFLVGISDIKKYNTQTYLQTTELQRRNGERMTGELYINTLVPNDKPIGNTGSKPNPTYGEDQSLTRWEDRISMYEKEIWGRDFSTDIDRKFQTYFYTDRYRNAGKDGTAMLKKHGFDIYITYGPAVEAQRYAAWQTPNPAEAKAIGSYSFKTTVKAIRNVQITSCMQRIGADGSPISEIYEFIAKDLD